MLDSVAPLDGPDPFYRDSTRPCRACSVRCAGARAGGPPTRWPTWAGSSSGSARAAARCAAPWWTRAAGTGVAGSRAWTCFSMLLAGDFDPTLRAAFPGAVEAALGGDVTPMLRLRRRAIEIDAEPPPPRAAQLSGVRRHDPARRSRCRGRAPRRPTRPSGTGSPRRTPPPFPDSAFEPFDRATALASDTLELCESWPAAPVAPDLGSGQFPDVPVLLVEGADDLRTPVGNAQQAAQPFPRARSWSLPTPATPPSARTSTAARSGRSPGSSSAGVFRTGAGPGRTRSLPSRRRPGGYRQSCPSVTHPAIAEGRSRRRSSRCSTWSRTRSPRSCSARGRPTALAAAACAPGDYRIGSGQHARSSRRVAYVPGRNGHGPDRAVPDRREAGRVRIGGRSAPHGLLRFQGFRITGRLAGRRVRGNLRSPVTVTGSAIHDIADTPLDRLGALRRALAHERGVGRDFASELPEVAA